MTMAPGLEDDLGFLLARTHRAMRRWLVARLTPLGVTYKQFQVLNALCEKDNLSQVELAQRVNMDQTSLARMLVRMEHAELVQRSSDAADARVNRVSLTQRGRQLRRRVIPRRRQGLEQATCGLSEKEVKELKRLLNQVYRNMGRTDPE
jgi:DNA-binding MarR family transcriptional regulator